MIPIMLLMLAGGIGLTQAVSDPAAVTLRWLRLGGLIAVTLLALAVVAAAMQDHAIVPAVTGAEQPFAPLALIVVILLTPAFFQLMLTQIGKRRSQRACAISSFILISAAVWVLLFYGLSGAAGREHLAQSPEIDVVNAPKEAAMLAVTAPLATGLLGGFLMTMLIGHAYLTAGNEMTQAPFRRLVALMGLLLLLRAIASVVFGLLPWLASERTGSQLWPMMMITARYATGIVVTGAFTWMTWDCVKRRANQSATGILYVAGLLVIIGEWSALALLQSTGFAF